MRWTAADELAHQPASDVVSEEWTFSCWAADGSLGLITGYRLIGAHEAWYWWALARRGEPLLHVTEFDIPRRADPLLAKAEAMWAELTCESPFEQWTVGNETYAVALDDPQEALRRAYGQATPIAMDIEWYAVEHPPVVTPIEAGYEQHGTVHGRIELAAGVVELVELPAHRTHRWSSTALTATVAPSALAHVGLRAPFLLPDQSIIDLVLTPAGWRSRT